MFLVSQVFRAPSLGASGPTQPSPQLGSGILPYLLWRFRAAGLNASFCENVFSFSLGGGRGRCLWGQCGDVRYNSVIKEGALSLTENANVIIIYWLLNDSKCFVCTKSFKPHNSPVR